MAEGEISFSLGPLQELGASFARAGGARSASAQRRTLTLLRQLGDTATPLLLRKLGDSSADEASWAYFLLAQLGGTRVTCGVRALIEAVTTPDDRKALGLALLSELGAELPGEVTLADPDALRTASVSDLVARLAEPADVARAAELLLEQVAPSDLGALLAEMVEVAGSRVSPLLDELLARDDVAAEARPAVAALRARLPAGSPLPRPRGRVVVWLGRADDGRRVVLATRATPGGRRRAVAVATDPSGLLAEAQHVAELAPRRGLLRLQAAWRARGFRLSRTRVGDAARFAAEALLHTRRAAQRVPAAFYLGRDLLGLDPGALARRPARMPATAPASPAPAPAPASPAPASSAPTPHERGGDLAEAERMLDEGHAGAAARLAERYARRHPEDAEGRSLLSMCLLALGRHDEAVTHAAAAAHLAPDEAAYHWNHAHAAKMAGKMGACFLSLRRYLVADDLDDGAAERAEIARRFLALFERYARLEHPDATVLNVARCEELFERAYAHLEAKRHTEARSGFEAVLKLVPSHHPSWSNLGVCLLALRQHDEAARCLKHALELRPDYEVAKKNLALLPGV